jgi:hypothetical protein
METNIQEEIWKDVVGYEGLYQVSNSGIIKSLKRNVKHWRGGYSVIPPKELKQQKPKGYARVTLTDQNGNPKIIFVHRIVALAFIGPPPEGKIFINHKNFIRDDNTPDNLEWVNSYENMKHLVKNNRSLKGCKNPSAILNEAQVLEIKSCNLSFNKMSELYGVSIPTLEAIRYGRTWKSVK